MVEEAPVEDVLDAVVDEEEVPEVELVGEAEVLELVTNTEEAPEAELVGGGAEALELVANMEEALEAELAEEMSEGIPEGVANVDEAPAVEAMEEELSTLDQLAKEANNGNGSIISLEPHQLMAMMGGKKVNLGKVAANLDEEGNLILELKK